MRVFVVEDSLPIRQRLTRMLAELKDVEIVGEAAEANAAIESIHSLKPDVILLDIRLSGQSSGFDVLHDVKQMVPMPLVIVLTVHPYPQYRDRCLEEGVAYFFDKSTDFTLIVPVLKHLLRQEQSNRAFSDHVSPAS